MDDDKAKDWIGKIDQAQSIERLEQESQELKNMFLGALIRSKRRELNAIQRLNGNYLVDAQSIFYLDEPDKNDSKPAMAFDMICRQKTPAFYQDLVKDAAEAANKTKQKPNLGSAGTNESYKPGATDAFNNSRPVKAHVLPDSYTCLPSYGQMVEGATGPISEGEGVRNRIRLFRALGSKSQRTAGLRTHKKNFLSLPSDHTLYFDTQPQVALVPLLSLKEIVNYDGQKEYDVAVLVMSYAGAKENQEKVDKVEQVYQKLMKSYAGQGYAGSLQ